MVLLFYLSQHSIHLGLTLMMRQINPLLLQLLLGIRSPQSTLSNNISNILGKVLEERVEIILQEVVQV